jgi:hypothetical protein
MKRFIIFLTITVAMSGATPDPKAETVTSAEIPGFAYIHDTTKFVLEDAKELTVEARRALGVVKVALAQRLGKEIEGHFSVAVATWGYQVNFTGLKTKKDGIWTDLTEGFGEAFLSKDLAKIKIDYGP